MGSTLDSEKVSTIDGTTNHILKFTGDKSFTVIESPMVPSNEVNVEEIDGEVIDLVAVSYTHLDVYKRQSIHSRY